MAKFKMELPVELMKAFKDLEADCDEIFEEMTEAGAEVALHNIEHNMPASFRDSDIKNCLGIRDTEKTANQVSTRVDFRGDFTNENGQKENSALVAGVFEYGKSNFQKQPFMRKSFKKKQINDAMMKKQEELMKKYET